MYNISIATKQTTHGVKTSCYDSESHENQKMVIGEQVDKLGDRIIRRDAFQQFTLANPSLRYLVTGHLNPYGIYRISRYRFNVRNNNSLTTNYI